jgi:bifunctional UDP-N-acetylglucosamine pyrophosphorylase/glucosamine-1-phosphate N-acetyltransferase
MMAEKEGMHGVVLKEWRDVVYPWHLLDANAEMMKNLAFTCQGAVSDGATLNGEVSIGKGTDILPGTVIEGPVIIGENCKIGPNCYIRPATTIGDNCHVGNACEVKNSLIFNNSNVPHQNYIGDSVIGEGCNLGAGTKIANLRFDKKSIYVCLNGEKKDTNRRKLGMIMGDNVQTGINSMINVGTLVGNNVFIGPGASVTGELQPNVQVF